MRIAIIGNSGSGKSTLARWLADRSGSPTLDLDTVAWEPGKIAVARSAAAAEDDVRAFCAAHRHWVVEGCYANLVGAALHLQPRLLFLDPGREACLANCRARPWEPHKYPSKEAQDERLESLLSWVADYYTRGGLMSWAAHQALYASYQGDKQICRDALAIAPPSDDFLVWAQALMRAAPDAT